MGGFSIFGRVSSGLFSARLGWHRLLSLSYFGMSASMVCLLVLNEIWMLHVFAFSYGVFHGVRISSQVGVLPEIFGMRSLGEAIGLTAAAGQRISAFSPYVVGALFDTRGSYSLAFLPTAILLVAGGVVAGLVRRIAVSMSPPPSASR